MDATIAATLNPRRPGRQTLRSGPRSSFFTPHLSAWAFAFGALIGVRTTWALPEVKTWSKLAAYFASRSQRRNLGSNSYVQELAGQVPRLLGDPGRVGMGGDATYPYPPPPQLEEEQYVEAPQPHRVDGKEVGGQDGGGLGPDRPAQVGRPRRGPGPRWLSLRMRVIVLGARWTPSLMSSHTPASSPTSCPATFLAAVCPSLVPQFRLELDRPGGSIGDPSQSHGSTPRPRACSGVQATLPRSATIARSLIIRAPAKRRGYDCLLVDAEVSASALRKVRFQEKSLGYDRDDVDEFIERVAAGVELLHDRLRQLTQRAVRAEQRPTDVSDDDGSLSRTLALAQRAADIAKEESQQQTSQTLEEAQTKAQAIIAEAEEQARHTTTDAERQLQAELVRLESARHQLHQDLILLERHAEDERGRIRAVLSNTQAWLDQHLLPMAPAPPLSDVDVPPPPTPSTARSEDGLGEGTESEPDSSSEKEVGADEDRAPSLRWDRADSAGAGRHGLEPGGTDRVVDANEWDPPRDHQVGPPGHDATR